MGEWGPSAQDDSEDEDTDGEELAATGTPRLAIRQVSHGRVVRALAESLGQTFWRWRQEQQKAGGRPAEDLRLVAAILLDALLGALGDWMAVASEGPRATDQGPRSTKVIVLRRGDLAGRIERLLSALPWGFTVQPLSAPVAYEVDDPGPADGTDSEHVCIDLIGYRRSNTFLRRLHQGVAQEANRAPGFLRYVEAVNLQQAVPWRLNRDLLHWARQLRARDEGDAPPAGGEAAGAGRARTARPVDILDSPLARPVLDALAVDGADGLPRAFYLPWKADYRGRIYAETPWLTPQGGDLQRALFELARGRELNEGGVRALRRHGANLVKRERLIADLGIAGRQVVTLIERERWVEAHEQEILACAADPLGEPFWQEVAGKPMQFLAFCLAYAQWKRDPGAPIHLPVQIDGTCNGLQHIAALTGDVALARAVNVLPADDGLPGDIYSELAAAAAERLGSLDEMAGEDRAFGVREADLWLAGLADSRGWVNRGTAKKVVMTIPYGASPGAQARHVLEAIAGDFESAWAASAPSLQVLDALVAWRDAMDGRRAFVARCARRLLTPPPGVAFSEKDDLETLLARQEWERKRTLAAYTALCIVEHLRAALDARYPAVNDFSTWLKRTAKACEGLPLLWPTPLGFPVCQDKFQLRGTSVTARLGKGRVRLDLTRLGETVSPARQRNALLPNLIHGLDATHLALTLLEARARGVTDVGSIHDCLLCHPNDAAALGGAVRRTFVQLYAPGRLALPDPLIAWRDWMALLMELRLVRRRTELHGALTAPAEQAEQDLRHDAARGERDADHALRVLERIRRRDPSERYLLGGVLAHAVNHGDKLEIPKKPPVMPDPPCAGGLPWGEGALSEYFFS